jgi:chaperone BCS1
MCLYGPPGTGKTTLSLAIANYTKRRVYCLNMNSLENDARMYQAFSAMSENAILLIEDIDKVFCGRDNVEQKAGITFSTFLNCMDGALYKHGILSIITTNHLDKLDEALLRTGRTDLKIEVPLPGSKEIAEYLAVFYNKPIFALEGGYSYKMSDIQEICLQNKNNFDNALKIIQNGQTTRMDFHLQPIHKEVASNYQG